MNKRNRKQFEKRIQANRIWLATHSPITRWEKMYDEVRELLLHDPLIANHPFGEMMRIMTDEFFPYVHL